MENQNKLISDQIVLKEKMKEIKDNGEKNFKEMNSTFTNLNLLSNHLKENISEISKNQNTFVTIQKEIYKKNQQNFQ